LCNEGEKATNIHCRLQLQFEEECLSRSSVFQWCQMFKDDHECVSNVPHAACSTTTVNQGPVCVDFLLERKAMNAAYYYYFLKHKFKPAIRTKRCGQLSKGVIIVHDNACPHNAQVTGNGCS
jgi:hypothetical protein